MKSGPTELQIVSLVIFHYRMWLIHNIDSHMEFLSVSPEHQSEFCNA